MNEKPIIRQGDVLLVPVSIEVPRDAMITNSVILAEGETTGHNHVLEAPKIARWEDFVCIMDDMGTLSHPDHDPKPARVVPTGTYRVVRQKEFSLSGMWTQVRD